MGVPLTKPLIMSRRLILQQAHGQEEDREDEEKVELGHCRLIPSRDGWERNGDEGNVEEASGI